MATNKLLDEFPPVSTEAWEAAIQRDLKDAHNTKKLLWQTDEGLAVKPYYRAEDIAGLAHLIARPEDIQCEMGACPSGGWCIREEVDASSPGQANSAARHAVSAGAEAIAFSSVVIKHPSDLAMLLANLQEIPLHFENAGEPLLRLLIGQMDRYPIAAQVSTGFDPLTNLDFAADVLRQAQPTLIPFTIHGEVFEESGANTVEEIGFTVAAGVEFLAEMQSRNVAIDLAAASLEFSFSIGASFFSQIAKLRAFRLLWAQVLREFDGAPEHARAHIHARTSRWNKTVYDPHGNILRGTTEAMSAAVGGADSISVAPFDACYKTPDEASCRLARNTQILLKQEALLSRVTDPGAGSYYLEVLTDFIARKSWELMQRIELSGGYRKACADGTIQRALDLSLTAKQRAVASRRRSFIGTNQYADPSETALDRVDRSRLLSNHRATLPYEQLRLRTERHAANTGRRPRILLAEFGDRKMRSARSAFAANFLACAGFNAVPQQFDNVEGIAVSHADLIVLCSSDPEYLAVATELIPRLNAHGVNTPVVIAGNPECAEQLRAAGVADFLHLRSDAIELLTKLQDRLGIEDK